MKNEAHVVIEVPGSGLIRFTPDDALDYIGQVRAGASPEGLDALVEATLARTRPPYDEAADQRQIERAHVTEFTTPVELSDDDVAWWFGQN